MKYKDMYHQLKQQLKETEDKLQEITAELKSSESKYSALLQDLQKLLTENVALRESLKFPLTDPEPYIPFPQKLENDFDWQHNLRIGDRSDFIPDLFHNIKDHWLSSDIISADLSSTNSDFTAALGHYSFDRPNKNAISFTNNAQSNFSINTRPINYSQWSEV